MKNLKQLVILVFLITGTCMYAQITLNACNPLLENQDYTFNQISTDVTGRNVFETNPVTGDQDCGGIGVCEMQVAWNNTNSRWEIYADDGNGTFANTFLLYYNTEASTPNPPSLSLGTWEENIAVTASLCVDGITTLTGDVQDTTLGVANDVLNQIKMYPNPASDIVYIRGGNLTINKVIISDVEGRIVLNNLENFQKINVTNLSKGLYFVNIQAEGKHKVEKLIIQ